MTPNAFRRNIEPRSKQDSRALGRGALGDDLDGRSPEGRFVRQAERELLAQLGRQPTFAETVLIHRAVRLMLTAAKLDSRLTGAEVFTPSDLASAGGVSGALVDVLSSLGLRSPVRA